MAHRYFTLEKAQELVAWLEETFQALRPLQDRADRLNQEIGALLGRIQSNGGARANQELGHSRRDLEKVSGLINARVEEVQERGIIVRSIERGLVDFPSVKDGREVHLSWVAGEAEVRFWHEADAGFAGRQPL